MTVFLHSLQLHAFRNYREAVLYDLKPGFVVLTGCNGAGKTNILEAISLLAPGRGLRGARMADLRHKNAPAGVSWSLASVVESPVGEVRIGTGMREGPTAERRIVRVNGVDLKTQADLSEYLSCIWLTPQMDGLFLGPASDRRRFFDRLVFAFDPAHAGRVTRYESVLSQRMKLLRRQQSEAVAADPLWLASLEATMAETGVAIAAARLQTLESLSAHLGSILEGTGFPASILALPGGIEEALQTRSALDVEDMMRAKLAASRVFDGTHGMTSVGPHRTDVQVLYADKTMPAAQCSTGEQKALLTGIVLAHAVRTRDVRDAAPILLLDEVAAHFDALRRESLFSILQTLGGQVFLTGTEAATFSPISAARHIKIAQDRVEQKAGVAA